MPQIDAVSFYLSPLGLAIIYIWTFASLTAVQLTVRLILRFEMRETALAAVLLSLATLVIGLVYLQLSAPSIDAGTVERLRQQGQATGLGEHGIYLYVVQQRLRWLPVTLVPLLAINWTVARWVLRMRPRSSVVCALAMSLLIAPWPALLFI